MRTALMRLNPLAVVQPAAPLPEGTLEAPPSCPTGPRSRPTARWRGRPFRRKGAMRAWAAVAERVYQRRRVEVRRMAGGAWRHGRLHSCRCLRSGQGRAAQVWCLPHGCGWRENRLELPPLVRRLRQRQLQCMRWDARGCVGCLAALLLPAHASKHQQWPIFWLKVLCVHTLATDQLCFGAARPCSFCVLCIALASSLIVSM